MVKLGSTALDEVRRRVQQETLGRRGLKDDPLYRIRRTLMTGTEHLTSKQKSRLEQHLPLGDPNGEVHLAWQAYQRLRAIYHATTTTAGHRLAEHVIATFHTCPIPEIARLGRTLRAWRDQILAYFATDGVNNGGTEAINGVIEKTRRLAHGFRNFTNYRLRILLAADAGSRQTMQNDAPLKPTIVLVHGAWADGSSWSAVTSKLQSAGYTVDVEANPLRGLASDAQYLRDLLATIPGPVVLVGHSYGGMVTTSAATSNPNVKALVYVDAFIPDQGDSVGALAAAEPGSELDPNSSITTVPIHDASGNVINADVYIKPNQFAGLFAGGIPAKQAAVLAATQRPLTASTLSETLAGVPAWKTIPSWDLIGTADKVLPPAEQQIMAHRAGAHITKVDAPHLSMISDPDAVTDVIVDAARATS